MILKESRDGFLFPHPRGEAYARHVRWPNFKSGTAGGSVALYGTGAYAGGTGQREDDGADRKNAISRSQNVRAGSDSFRYIYERSGRRDAKPLSESGRPIFAGIAGNGRAHVSNGSQLLQRLASEL